MNLNNLRKSPLLHGLSDKELKELIDGAERVSLRAGDILIKQGDPGNSAFVLIRGELEIRKQSGPSLVKVEVRNPGDVVGEMALLSHAPRCATVLAKTDAEILCIGQKPFEELLASSSTVAMAVLQRVMARLPQHQSLLYHQEKMAALGTISAGLAHELNNPASAAQRSAAELGKTLIKWQALTQQIQSAALKASQTEWLDDFLKEAERHFESPLKMGSLEKIDMVNQLQAWLESNRVESAGRLLPPWSNSVGILKRFKS